MRRFAAILSLDWRTTDPDQVEKLESSFQFRKHARVESPSSEQEKTSNCLLVASGLGEAPLFRLGKVTIVGDIRLDSRATLKARLGNADLSSQTTDLELVGLSYLKWGRDCLTWLTGDFSFCLWDEHKRCLVGACDRFGIRPLFYVRKGDTLYVSNSQRWCLSQPCVSRCLNNQAIQDYLCFSQNMERETTFFRDIGKLRPATYLYYSRDQFRVEQYWRPEISREWVEEAHPAEYSEEFRELLKESVRERCQGQPTDTQLSGGLDSGSIAVLLKEVLGPKPCRAYCTTYNRMIINEEGHYAWLTAKKADLLTDFLVAEDYLERSVWEPGFVSVEPSAVFRPSPEMETAYRVSQTSRSLLAGFGGDPLLWVPPRPARTASFKRRALWLAWRLLTGLPRYIKNRVISPPMSERPRPPSETITTMFNEDFESLVNGEVRLQELTARGVFKLGLEGMFSAPLWSHISYNSDPEVTGYPMSVHFPFFSAALFDFLSRRHIGPSFEDKGLLREAMRHLLPESVRTRPKSPLAPNAMEAMTQTLLSQESYQKLLECSEMEPYIDKRTLEAMLTSARPLATNSMRQLQNLWSLAFWLQNSGAG